MSTVDTAPDHLPVTADEADVLFSHLTGADALLLAVSGGPDSLALLHLAAGWRAGGLARGEPRPQVFVAVVDHLLRPESAGEAQAVMACAREAGLAGTTLVWAGDKPATGISEAARIARYDLLFAHARTIGASHVLTAHHADDLAETILMRLCAGSGLTGLAGMAPLTDRNGVWLARPLLSLAKSRLIASCEAAGMDWAEDPGNRDPKQGRGRLRSLADELAALGLGRERLLRLGKRAARADAALEHAVDCALADAGASITGAGFSVNMRRLAAEPLEIAIRATGRLMGQARQARSDMAQARLRPLRLERLERAVERLVDAALAGRNGAATIGGMALRVDQQGHCRATGELGRARQGGKSGGPD